MEKTFEELLREEMAVPVKVTNAKEGQQQTIDSWRACVIAIKNKAVKGDIQAILFIKSMTEGAAKDIDEDAVRENIDQTAKELHHDLRQSGLPVNGVTPELWLLAKQLLTLRRIALTTAASDHVDITATPQKNGPDRLELSTDNRIFNDLLKQWRTDWKEYKAGIIQAEMQRRMLTKK